jgi:hypothetical protein
MTSEATNNPIKPRQWASKRRAFRRTPYAGKGCGLMPTLGSRLDFLLDLADLVLAHDERRHQLDRVAGRADHDARFEERMIERR